MAVAAAAGSGMHRGCDGASRSREAAGGSDSERRGIRGPNPPEGHPAGPSWLRSEEVDPDPWLGSEETASGGSREGKRQGLQAEVAGSYLKRLVRVMY